MKVQRQKSKVQHQRGASRVDVVAAAAMAALLALWFGFSRLGERGRVGRCAHNLKVLGQGINSYANDHDDGLPAAAFNLKGAKTSWDVDLFPYLKPTRGGLSDVSDQKLVLLAYQPLFSCPSDPIPRNGPLRSYAMSGRDMMHPWPPSSDDRTGVGLFWAERTAAAIGGDLGKSMVTIPELLPKLKRSVLPDPAGTLLLTELMTPGNKMADVSSARLWGVNDQEPVLKKAPRLHFGTFNYLMADGHVARLTKLQAGWGSGRETFFSTANGIWTIKAGD